jgi:hypothetical protein
MANMPANSTQLCFVVLFLLDLIHCEYYLHYAALPALPVFAAVPTTHAGEPSTSASGESIVDAATIAAAPGSSAAVAAAAAASVMDATPTTGKVCVCIDVMCVQQSNGV